MFSYIGPCVNNRNDVSKLNTLYEFLESSKI